MEHNWDSNWETKYLKILYSHNDDENSYVYVRHKNLNSRIRNFIHVKFPSLQIKYQLHQNLLNLIYFDHSQKVVWVDSFYFCNFVHTFFATYIFITSYRKILNLHPTFFFCFFVNSSENFFFFCKSWNRFFFVFLAVSANLEIAIFCGIFHPSVLLCHA